MKKVFLAVFLLAVLAVPSYADIGLRIGGSLDVATKFKTTVSYMGISADADVDFDPGFSLHAAFAPFITDDQAIRLGGGLSYWIPRSGENTVDVSNLTFYATSLIYPGRFGGGDLGLYGKVNLGYNLPNFEGDDEGFFKGGFYFGLGLGFEFAENFFVEGLFGRYGISIKDDPDDPMPDGMSIKSRFTTFHIGFGFKF